MSTAEARVLDALARLGAASTVEEFRAGACHELGKVLSAAWVAIDTVALRRSGVRHHSWPEDAYDVDTRLRLHVRHGHEHPLLARLMPAALAGQPVGGIQTLRDVAAHERRAFEGSALWARFYRPAGIEDQAAFALAPRPGELTLLSVALHRPLTPEQRAELECWRPHLVNLDRLMRWREVAAAAPDDGETRLVDEALARIAAAPDFDGFAQAVCREVLSLVPGLWASYNLGRLDPADNWARTWPPGVPRTEGRALLAAEIGESPLARHIEATGGPCVATLRELDPTGRFFGSELYRSYYRPHGMMNQAVFGLPGPHGVVVAVVVNRGDEDFTAAERRLLNLLRARLLPLQRAVTEQERVRDLERARARDGWEWVRIGADGVVVAAADKAVVLGRSAGLELAVGASVADADWWPSEVAELSLLDSWAHTVPVPVAVPDFRVALTLHAAEPATLWLRGSARPTVEGAIRLGLTRRQAQVAVEITAGATNQQIASLLGISAGTVRKHVESVLRALGVDSRTAVASVVMRQAAGRDD
ncbi:helix-turn-helix transcriptional regulator [Nocardioides humi]|uniref:HTH luxR-type domain-containing protein n=1 Tax=Nocardioides humi TaxID=449461 RepID=A0ABN1ZZR5_9ACTN|nr:helix-turn-helix transcriptional regulator [Nocardioides humi]